MYRVRQFLYAARAQPLQPGEERQVRSILGGDALALFQTMPLGDQRHALEILNGLLAQGITARPPLQAALLHDVAKREIGLGYRTAVVLLTRLSPTALERLASPDPRSVRYPFYLSLHHPERGAELAARAGADPRAVALIRAHQRVDARFDGEDADVMREWHTKLKDLDDRN